MDRGRRTVATFFSDATPAISSLCELGADAAQHARVRRLESGSSVHVIDGRGTIASGEIYSLGRARMEVMIGDLRQYPPSAPLEVVLPVADKERMLWAMEKATELGATAIRPVLFARSRSVTGRGEGPSFVARAGARMRAALEQSGGAWLPTLHPQCTLEQLQLPESVVRFLLDTGGSPLAGAVDPGAAVAFVVGPEGGLEPGEREQLLGAGWSPVALAANTLRFETAAIAALAMAAATRLREIPTGHD